MAHLLPSAGYQEPKGDQYRFYNVVDNTACPRTFDDIPINIHDYRWSDYEHEDDDYCQDNLELAPSHNPYQQIQSGSPLVASGPGSASCQLSYSQYGEGPEWVPGYSYTEPLSGALGCCPPTCVDPRSLIRPLDKSINSSTRPTGQPYFAQDSRPSCPPHLPPLARKGGFNYKDWLATSNTRQQPDHLMRTCIPSLCTWCRPMYVDCCPDYKNPWAYTVSKNVVPY